MTKNQRIELRVSAFEKETWAKAAGGPRRVSEWLRSLANRAASGEGAGPGELADADVRQWEADKPIKLEPEALVTKCSRWQHHRSGVYCGSCHKVN